MLKRLVSIVFCLFAVSLPYAEQVRSVDDYQLSEIRGLVEGGVDEVGGKVDVTQRIFNALTGGDPANQVASQDLSRMYLFQMFGAVPGSFDGASNILSVVFRILNIGIISIASVLVIYTTVFAMSTTTHDGGAMGSGRFNGWSVARVVGSVSILVPTKSGYSYAQIIVMKVVVAGIVAANTVWEASIDYINQYGSNNVFVATPKDAMDQDYAKMLLKKGRLDEVARSDTDVAPKDSKNHYPKQRFQAYSLNGSTNSEGYFLAPINQAILDTVNMYKTCLPCMESGEVTTAGANLDRVTPNIKRGPGSLLLQMDFASGGETVTVRGFELTGLTDVWGRYLASYIHQVSRRLMIYQLKGAASEEDVANVFAQQLRVLYKNIEHEQSASQADLGANAAKVKELKRGGWVQAGIKYTDLTEMGRPPGDSVSYFDGFPADAKLKNYEYVVPAGKEDVKMVRKTLGISLDKEVRVLTFDKGIKQFTGFFEEKGYTLKEAYNLVKYPERIQAAYERLYFKRVELGVGQALNAVIKQIHGKFLDGMKQDNGAYFGEKMNPRGLGLGPLAGWPIIVDPNIIARDVNVMSHQVVVKVLELMRGDVNENPIKSVGTAGKSIIGISASFFGNSTTHLYEAVNRAAWNAYGISTGFTIAQGAMRAFAAKNRVEAMRAKEAGDASKEKAFKTDGAKFSTASKGMGMIGDPIMTIIEFSQVAAKAIAGLSLPMGNGLAVTYLVAGVVMAAYVPYIPTIIYIFSVLAWLFAVIEAMIAAPIVFIGLANPEGHDALGKSEQGLMLLIGVFLRPMLTLIGFLMALVLSYTLLTMFSALFKLSSLYYMKPIIQGGIAYPTLVVTFMAASLVVLYVYSMVVVLEQCYSMIYVIPDQILKWVGGPMDSAGSSIGSALRSASTGLTQQSKVATEGAGQASGGAMGISTRT